MWDTSDLKQFDVDGIHPAQGTASKDELGPVTDSLAETPLG